MSTGNANTDGNKKNNFSWQKNVLLMLKEVKLAVIAAGGGGGIGVTRTTSSIVAPVGTGSVAAGSKWINFITDDDFTGSVNGVTRINSFSFMMPPNGNDVYGVIPYIVLTGTLTIDRNF